MEKEVYYEIEVTKVIRTVTPPQVSSIYGTPITKERILYIKQFEKPVLSHIVKAVFPNDKDSNE